MSVFSVSKIFPSDHKNQRQVTQLLEAAGIQRDLNLDYTCGIFNEKDQLIATGSLFKNSLRCFAICQKYKGEGSLNLIVSHLLTKAVEDGHSHVFVYTKPDASHFFADLGFYPIVSIPELLTFMENRKEGFKHYLDKLALATSKNKSQAAIVLNANPFTLGHLHLIEKAALENEVLHLFMVSDDSSLIPFHIRKELILAGTAHLDNIIYHETGPYIISQATFPSYFQKDKQSVIVSQAKLDLTIFTAIANQLGIHKRYVGQEPHSQVTGIYNAIMQEYLPQEGIDCVLIPRKEVNGQIISASTVRQYLKDKQVNKIKPLVPKTTYDFFTSERAKDIINRIQKSKSVIHY
ncbi:[citrate (pro-3S)-lyase] ligase [Streptococcus iniae]|nr:[citrate (pro-3S)-lyase] ligase [Streptococcus iniae]WNZ94508.1 [citrate (pro-3S)-lyase] ligase [Streptococcus iniae]WNZ97482.1 [citrate (pro-3S)-lyase] ligase [Streptococcus iniae]